jgi:phage-related baseplate assembly protein
MAVLDFATIPAPTIIEALDYETILQDLLDDLRARDESYTAILESDPVVKLLEVVAARELILRQRVNDALQATLLRYATGADLDNLAAFYGVVRQAEEPDSELRERTIERIKGSSTAGGAAWYRYQTLTADPRVKDAAVSSPAPGQVLINILSTENNGQASEDLIEAVEDVVLADDVRVITDTVAIEPATITTVNVAAQVWLLPDAPSTVLDGIPQAMRDALAVEGGLGFDITQSWLISKIHVTGVQRVQLTTPTASVVCGPSAAPALGTITLTLAGRDR